MTQTTQRPISLQGEPNGVARVLHTVLAEKLAEAPWKASPVVALEGRRIRLVLTDRGESALVHVAGGEITVTAENAKTDTLGKAGVVVSLDMKALPLILGVPLGPLRLPALWQKGGRALLGAIGSRRVRVRGLVTHPAQVVRVLQILGVPPGTIG